MKELERMQRETERELDKLQHTKEEFNHSIKERHMELDKAIDTLLSIIDQPAIRPMDDLRGTDNYDDDLNRQLEDISKDLDDLLNDL